MRERIFHPVYSSDITVREINNALTSKRAAEEGIVLLKNNGVLPLKRNKKIALYGAGAKNTIEGGWGSGDVNERKNICVKLGLEKSGYTITTQKWIDDYQEIYEKELEKWKQECEDFRKGNMDKYIVDAIPFIMPAGRLITDQDIQESDTDTAIYVLTRTSGEGADRKNIKGDYKLFDEEVANLKKLVENYKKVILIINAGGVINLSFLNEITNIGAIIYMSQAGTAGGYAIANILSGKVTPSGKLADTWVDNYEDYPISKIQDDQNYEEGIYVGYRYFDAFNIRPRYEFGYGLSYTNFSIEVSEVSIENSQIKCKIKVKNIGKKYPGKEVVQIYMSAPKGKIRKEYQKLVGFVKTKLLNPEEEQEIIKTIDIKDMKSYDEEEAAWILEKGKYIVRVGNSSRNTNVEAYINVTEKILLEKVKNICKLETELKEIQPAECLNENFDEKVPILELDANSIEKIEPNYTILKNQEAEEIVKKFSVEELCTIVCGAHNEKREEIKYYDSIIPGAAGETTSELKEKYGITNIVFADGPAGIKLNTIYKNNDKEAYQYCTGMPVGTLLAQTWNVKILQEVGYCIGGEMDEFGISIWLAPGMNIHRDPLCGRNFEYYSEDPFLTGMIASSIVSGLQKNRGIGAAIKHFACNNKEENRVFYDSIISERTLREIYLRGFEMVVKQAQPMAVMTSYNSINNVPTANSYNMCTQVLRNEWGFKGMVMTDWFEATIGRSTPSKAIIAGNDLMMPGHLTDIEELKQAIQEGSLKIEDLQKSAINILNIILKSNKYEE